MKNSFGMFINILDTAVKKKKISELEEWSTEIIQAKIKKREIK